MDNMDNFDTLEGAWASFREHCIHEVSTPESLELAKSIFYAGALATLKVVATEVIQSDSKASAIEAISDVHQECHVFFETHKDDDVKGWKM